MEETREQGLSRRGFLASAAALGVGATVAGLAGCASQTSSSSNAKAAETTETDWLGSAPEIAASEITETKTVDLLIIGAGNGGMAAAATAAEMNLDFMICEKMGSVQSTRYWFGAVDSKYTKAAGVSVDRGRLLNEFSRYASGICDQKVIKVWIDESASVVDWLDPLLTAAGCKCTLDTDTNGATGGTSYYIPPIEHYYAGTKEDGTKVARVQ